MVSTLMDLAPLAVEPWQRPALRLPQLRTQCAQALAQRQTVVVIAALDDAAGEAGAADPPDDAVLGESGLHPDDVARAQRYDRGIDRQRFVLGRRLLAWLLADGAALPPWPVAAGGKPLPVAGVHFNLSHAQRWLALALSRDGPVGVDIEGVAGFERQRRVVERISHPDELAWARDGAPDSTGTLRRLAVWTRKEALLKATGAGMGFDAVLWSSLGRRPIQAVAPTPTVDPSFGWHSFAPQPCTWLLSVAHRGAGVPCVLSLGWPLTGAVSST